MNTLLSVTARWLVHREPHGPMGPHGGYGGEVMSWGGVGLGFVWQLVGLLMAIAVVLAGTYLVITLLQDQDPNAEMDDALAVLRHRYARGEIDEEEFKNRASQLSTETAK